jgi:hypothetical protein
LEIAKIKRPAILLLVLTVYDADVYILEKEGGTGTASALQIFPLL